MRFLHRRLWRLSVPSTAAAMNLGVAPLIEWGGALRWIAGAQDAAGLRKTVCGSRRPCHVVSRGDKSAGVFHPLDPVLARIHRNLKNAFDPANILNRGRMDNF